MNYQIDIINQAIIASYPEIEKLDNTTSIVKGYVQSGKTRFELCVIWRCLYVLKTPVIFILSNNINSFLQVQTRDLAEFNAWIDYIFVENRLQNLQLTPQKNNNLTHKFDSGLAPLLKDAPKRALLKDEGLFIAGRDAKSCMQYSDYFLRYNSADAIVDYKFNMILSNPSQLKKIFNIITDNNINNISLIVDEADCSVKDIELQQTITKTGNLFDKIVEKSRMICQVTATPFANLNKKSQQLTNCYLLPRPENYRGIGEIKFHPCDENLRLVKNIDMLVNLVVKSIQYCGVCPSGYKSILLNASHSHKQQKNQAKLIKHAAPFLKVYAINTHQTSQIKEMDIHGNYQSLNTCNISDLYRIFEIEKYDNIIISCYKASRANSYRPIREDGSGGLTGMIYLPTKASHCAQLIQSMRIFGIYEPDYPQINLWTTSDVYWKITREIVNIDVITKQASTVPQYTREMLSDVSVYNVGKHDRKNIDDTNLINQYSLISKEYDSFELAQDFILGDLKYQNVCETQGLPSGGPSRLVQMNLKPAWIELPSNFSKCSLKNRELQNFIKQQLLDIMSNNVDYKNKHNNNNIRVRFAHNWNYYKRLFDLQFRYKNEISDFVVGFPECGNKIPYVKWFPEYCSRAMKIDDLSANQIYWYYTCTGKIRIYCKNLQGIKIGSINHKK